MQVQDVISQKSAQSKKGKGRVALTDRERTMIAQLRQWKQSYSDLVKKTRSEQNFYKKEATEMALMLIKNKNQQMIKVFSSEAKKLLVQFTKLRLDLIDKCQQIRMISLFAVNQEKLISENREFIVQNLMPFFEVMQKVNIESEKETIAKFKNAMGRRLSDSDLEYEPKQMEQGFESKVPTKAEVEIQSHIEKKDFSS